MAQRVMHRIVGIDVSKSTLDVFEWETERAYSLPNERKAIERWLRSWNAPIRIAIEPTNHYHQILAETAYALGHAVYLVAPYRLLHYRESVGERVKSDRQDAQLLARYLAREAGELRVWNPLSSGEKKLWRLLKRRAKLVGIRTQLRESLATLVELADQRDEFLASLDSMIRAIERAMNAQAHRLGWREEIRRCQALPGIGPLSALALVATYHRGTFCSADAYIAFMGLDVRVRDSGKYRGRRKLTKKGEPELRRLLFNAGMQGRRNALWEPYYLTLRERGLSATASFIALGRKLARVCFALLRSGTEFNPNHRKTACIRT